MFLATDAVGANCPAKYFPPSAKLRTPYYCMYAKPNTMLTRAYRYLIGITDLGNSLRPMSMYTLNIYTQLHKFRYRYEIRLQQHRERDIASEENEALAKRLTEFEPYDSLFKA